MKRKPRYGDFMQTFGERKFYPLDPRVGDFRIEDIAHHLAMICRYGGAVSRFYSVAEHSVHVSRAVRPEYAFEALLHDAAEAYIGDMVRPLKHQAEMSAFRAADDRIERVIREQFKIDSTLASRDAIKLVDNRILRDETIALMGRPSWSCIPGVKRLGVKIEGWLPKKGEREFMKRYKELT